MPHQPSDKNRPDEPKPGEQQADAQTGNEHTVKEAVNDNKDNTDVPDLSEEHEAAAKAKPITHRDKRSKYIFHSLQIAGGTGLAASAVFDGNIGRLVTGFSNAARNTWQLTKLFNTKSRKSERKNEVLMNTVSAGTNAPQLATAASLSEGLAAGSAVMAYGLRTARYKFSRKLAQKRAALPPTGHTAMNILIKSTNKIMRLGPSVLLFSRGITQTIDGLGRNDWAAFGAGIAFTTGAIFMAFGDRKRAKIAKQIKEEKQEKKRARRETEKELEIIKEMDPQKQMQSPDKPDKVQKHEEKQKQKDPANGNSDGKPGNKSGGNVQSVPKRTAAKPPRFM